MSGCGGLRTIFAWTRQGFLQVWMVSRAGLRSSPEASKLWERLWLVFSLSLSRSIMELSMVLITAWLSVRQLQAGCEFPRRLQMCLQIAVLSFPTPWRLACSTSGDVNVPPEASNTLHWVFPPPAAPFLPMRHPDISMCCFWWRSARCRVM